MRHVPKSNNTEMLMKVITTMHMKTTQCIMRHTQALPTNELWKIFTDLLSYQIIDFLHDNFVASLLVLM